MVKLPFGRTVASAKGKPGKSQLVRVKENVAKELGLKPITTLPTQSVTSKTAKGSATFKRVNAQGSYRRISITLIFSKAKTVGKSPGTYKTVALPLGSGCTVTDAILYFQKNGKSKGIVGIRTPAGQTIRWDTSD
ncbi:hypothetical protein [Tolypothrix tenuis]|uniref:hypothetical protein n=1 Tax=Tolypothrix tenuis TaxID=457083 RepID=UPI0016882895